MIIFMLRCGYYRCVIRGPRCGRGGSDSYYLFLPTVSAQWDNRGKHYPEMVGQHGHDTYRRFQQPFAVGCPARLHFWVRHFLLRVGALTNTLLSPSQAREVVDALDSLKRPGMVLEID